MADEPIKAGEFNAAMKGVKDALSGFGERLSAIETLNQAALMQRVAEAKEEGKREGRLEGLEKRLDRLSWTLNVLAAGFVGQLLWWIFSQSAKAH